MSTIAHEKGSLNSITGCIQWYQTVIGIFLLVGAASDRVTHCHSSLQLSCPVEISASQICLINQYVKIENCEATLMLFVTGL